jgi:hypothetical protein
MRTLLLIAALLAVGFVPARAADLGTLEGKWPLQDLDELRVHFPIGELIIESSDASEIRAELSVRCPDGRASCVERSRDLRLVTNVLGRTRHIRLEGMPKFGTRGLEVTLRIAAPKTLGVDAEMGVGSLRVDGMARDLRLELGVGDVSVIMSERDVRSANLTVGIGDATLRHGTHAQVVSGLLGRKVRWNEGPGAARVSVELGIGDIDVRLD